MNGWMNDELKGAIKVIAFISWAMAFLKLLSIEQDAFTLVLLRNTQKRV